LERKYIEYLDAVAQFDIAEIKRKDAEYGGSWIKRGGIGAFLNLVRKWDRLDEQVSRSERNGDTGIKFDIFQHIRSDTSAETVLDTLRDLRRYAMLIEAAMVEYGVVALPGALPRARTMDPEPPRAPVPAGYTRIGSGVHARIIRRELNHKEYTDLPDVDKTWYFLDETDGKYKVRTDGQVPRGFDASEEYRPGEERSF
jgi:hypothetical protein